MTTIAEAKATVKAELSVHGETVCPCCDARLRTYQRSICTTNAKELIHLVQMYDGEHPIHYEDLGHQVGSFYQMQHWGLIENVPNGDESKRGSGLWKPTTKGVQFVLGKIKVRKYCITFRNKPIAWEGDMISIQDAFKNPFDYTELMKGHPHDVGEV
jgi:hypothetical protein